MSLGMFIFGIVLGVLLGWLATTYRAAVREHDLRVQLMVLRNFWHRHQAAHQLDEPGALQAQANALDLIMRTIPHVLRAARDADVIDGPGPRHAKGKR